MKSLITKLFLFCLLATSAAPMHGNWLTNIGHGIDNSVSSTFNRALWRTKAFWQCGFLAARTWESLTDDEQLTLIAAGRIKANKLAKIHKEDKKELLFLAAKNDNAEAAKILIKAGADVNAKNFDKETPLHRAVRGQSPQVAKVLINARADVNAKNRDGRTPLHIITWCPTWKHGSKAQVAAARSITKLLIDAGANVNTKNFDEETPLHIAALKSPVVTKVLIDAGADVNAKNRNGETPLHNAARWGGPQVAKILLNAGADVNAKDSDEKTPLHNAGWDQEVVKLLLNRGADVNAKSSHEKAPLHYAAIYRCRQTYDLLLKAGALQPKDNEGKTPEDFLKKCDK